MKIYNLEVQEIITETPTIKSILFHRPSDFHHKPGQFSWLEIPSIPNKKVPMAIASGTKEKNLMFTVKKWGFLSEKLVESIKNDSILISEPLGTSIPLDLFSNSEFIFAIAGGTGITPIRSLIHSIDKRVTVFYGVRSMDDFVYKNEIENWHITKSVEINPVANDSNIKLGFVTSLLSPQTLNVSGIYFICGPKIMMELAIQKLLEFGIPEKNIFASIEKIVNGNVVGPVLPAKDIIYQN